MDTYDAKRMLKDLNLDLPNDQIDYENFIVILRNYTDVEDVIEESFTMEDF